MKTLKSYLRLTRAHTVPLETVPAVLGALLATGGQLTWEVFYWAIFGMGYHLVGYGHNSWADWKNGHDKDDPNKQHHPLNTGEIDPTFTTFLLTISAAILTVYTLLGVMLEGGVLAFLLINVGVAGAWLYNEWGKETKYKFLPIAVAHTTVFLIPYIGTGGEFGWTVVIGASTVFIWIVYQIAVSGELKDIHQDKNNLLHRFFMEGSEGDKKPHLSASLFSAGMRIIYMGFALLLLSSIGGGYTGQMIVIIALGLISVVLGNRMIVEHHDERNEALNDMALIEFLSLAMFTVALSPIVGNIPALVLIALSLLWVVSMNRLIWGTLIKPDV